jgi:drug/metabolite transporter (DMT)-like permease
MELLMLLSLGAIWGSSFLFMRIAAPLVGPVSLIQWRLISATIFLIPFARGDRKKLSARDFRRLILLGLLNSAIPFTLLAYASVHLSAGLTSVLNGTAPFFSALWGAFLFKERLSSRQKSGLFIGFLGVWILLSDKISFKTGATDALLPIIGGLVAGLCYGFTANYTKRYLTHIQPQRVAFWNCLFASLFLIPLSFRGPYPWNYEAKVLESALVLGIMCSAIAYLIFFRLIDRAGATRALMVTFLIPVFACLWAWIFLGEIVTLKMAIGASLVLWGIWRMIKK